MRHIFLGHTNRGLKAVSAKLSLFLAIGFLGTAAYAQEEEAPLDFYVEVSGEYDDNITVDDNDANSRRGDSALRFRARVGLSLYDQDRTSLTGRYSFFQSLYEDLTDFDLQMHGFSARAKTRAGKANLGLTYRYNYILLGGNEFQDVHTIRPDVGILIAKKTYLTAHYEFRTQGFDKLSLQGRNADRHSLGARLFFLLGGGKNVTAGYTINRHSADDRAFSFWGHTANASLKLPFNASDNAPVFRLRYQYRLRDYSGITPSINEVREDKRHTARAILEIPLGSQLEAELQYKLVTSDSNLSTVDFTSNTFRVALGWTF